MSILAARELRRMLGLRKAADDADEWGDPG